MPNNLATSMQNFVRQRYELTQLLIVELLVLKKNHNFQFCGEKRKLDDCDYLGRFLLQFHALIDVLYPADYLG